MSEKHRITKAGFVFIIALVTLLIVVVSAIATVALVLVAVDQNHVIEDQNDDIVNQAKANEVHIDCLIAYVFVLEPPDCGPLIADLVARGYLPEVRP